MLGDSIMLRYRGVLVGAIYCNEMLFAKKYTTHMQHATATCDMARSMRYVTCYATNATSEAELENLSQLRQALSATAVALMCVATPVVQLRDRPCSRLHAFAALKVPVVCEKPSSRSRTMSTQPISSGPAQNF